MNKKILILACIGLIQINILSGQTGESTMPCQEANLKFTSAQEEVLRDFLMECLRDGGYFINDKGVILLNVFTDQESINDPKGIARWDISYTIDDWFISNPPNKYFDYKGHLVLVWDQNSKAIEKSQSKTAIESVKQCLWDKIGDRLYQQPAKRYRWSSQKAPDGRPLEGVRRVQLGGGGYHIIFYKDGTYQKRTMA